MSAFVVSNTHINGLVRVAVSGPREATPSPGRSPWYGVQFAGRDVTPDRAEEIGAALLDENWKSVNYRYRESNESPGFVYFENSGPRLTAVEAIKAVHCYEYQACEHPEWESSAAFKFCNDFKNTLHSYLPGWDAAPWGID
jgi:hypothetical protein